MANRKVTKKEYVNWLNGMCPEQGDERWIIGGKIRMGAMWKRQYGEALQKHDPQAFDIGYRDYVRNLAK